MNKRIISTIALASILSAPTVFAESYAKNNTEHNAQHNAEPNKRHEKRIERLSTILQLTDEQSIKVKNAFETHHATRKADKEQAAASKKALKEDLSKILTESQMKAFEALPKPKHRKHKKDAS